MSRKFVIGDIHGGYKALIQVLNNVNFDYEKDYLFSVGDIADGWSQTPECIEEFMKMKNLVWCLGNHDKWCQDWFAGKMNMEGVETEFRNNKVYHVDYEYCRSEAYSWLSQGGKETYTAYLNNPHLIDKHRDFWIKKPVLYHVDNNRCFVHAGWKRDQPISECAKIYEYFLYWDRNFWSQAMSAKENKLRTEDNFDKVYIGHTSTTFWGHTEPMCRGGVWNMDTGAGWEGKLTIMNIDTEEFVQSSEVKALYPDESGRRTR